MTTERQALAGLTLTAAFWAGNALVARGLAGTIPPVALSFWRWVIPMLFLAPVTLAVWGRYGEVIRAHPWRLLWLALFSVTSFNTLLYLAAQYTTAINITLVSASMPLITAGLSALLLGQVPGPAVGAGALLALGGVLVILTRGDPALLASLSVNPGDLIMVLAVGVWALYSVLLKRWPVPLPPFSLLCILITLGTPMILPFYLWELSVTGPFSLTAGTLSALGYVALFPSVLAHFFWTRGVQRIGPARAAFFFYLMPLFTALIAVPVLGEPLELFHGAGACLILLGLILTSRAGRS